MAEQTTQEIGILLDSDGRAAYAVPRAVLEAHQGTPEQWAAVQEATGDTTGFGLGTDAPIYLLTAEILAPYRLSDEQRDALEAQQDDTASDDVAGLQYIGIFPQEVTVRGSFLAGWGGTGAIGTVSPWMARDPMFNADANYHPPLH